MAKTTSVWNVYNYHSLLDYSTTSVANKWRAPESHSLVEKFIQIAVCEYLILTLSWLFSQIPRIHQTARITKDATRSV